MRVVVTGGTTGFAGSGIVCRLNAAWKASMPSSSGREVRWGVPAGRRLASLDCAGFVFGPLPALAGWDLLASGARLGGGAQTQRCGGGWVAAAGERGWRPAQG
jgi:hypothetical protein